jgi:DNA-binding LacI/PurR family transcriptional regulator
MDIRQVAKQARVSTATVSRVINASAPVSEKTTERVRRAIIKLDFYPNSHARTLGSGKSRIYGLIISDITNPFFPELVKSFENIAVQHGQEVIVANTDYNVDRMELCIRRMIERKVDCVAIMTTEMEPSLADMLNQRRIPVVSLDTGTVGKTSSNIEVDYKGGIEKAVEHLVGLGHTRISFISSYLNNLKSTQMRSDAFLDVMRRNGLSIASSLVHTERESAEGGRSAMDQLLQMKSPPTAVIGVNDVTAIGMLEAIRHAGLRVPEDFSIIGYDDIAISAFMNPPLTTVHIHREELAKCAFNALYSVSQCGGSGRTYKIDTALIVRESTAAPRQNDELTPRQ